MVALIYGIFIFLFVYLVICCFSKLYELFIYRRIHNEFEKGDNNESKKK